MMAKETMKSGLKSLVWFSHCRRHVVVILMMAAMFVFASSARAFAPADADTIFSAYNKAYYYTNVDGGFFHATTDGGKTWFWERAEQMEMVLDVYERTTNTTCLTVFSNVFKGVISEYSTNWSQNEFNDDIMWMVIACARGCQLTGNTGFRDIAKSNFDICYARAWSTNLGGGLWWKTSNLSKNACVNGPASIAAFLLYQITGDTNYLAKARTIYKWERDTLFDAQSGQIYDSMDSRGKINPKPFTYNQGTFIGAANFLGCTNDAKCAADFTRDILCQNGIMPGYGQFGDGGGFNGICARWVARFMKDCALQKSYQKWLQANADAAWKMRRATDNLSWSRWSRPTPDGPLNSWACSSAVVIMQVVPPTQANKGF
jgi:predicted alpha-1,6-mannanase (GH76 family)